MIISDAVLITYYRAINKGSRGDSVVERQTPEQGRRRRYGRPGHGRTTFLAENGFGQTPFFGRLYIFFNFLPGNFRLIKSSNNIDVLSASGCETQSL